MSVRHRYFATVPRNLERMLAKELAALGAEDIQHTHAGVHFEGSLEVGYRATLWSRLANAVLLEIGRFPALGPEDLYEGTRQISWDDHLGVNSTLAVNFTSRNSEITHTRFGALKVKDGVVDQFRDAFGVRPSVKPHEPDVQINCHIDSNEATLSIDLSGSSLHRRGYRQDRGAAPLKENVAAAVLLRARWPEFAAEGRPLFDPMCGSGTLLLEGAMMAADQAPGLLRDYFGFLNWRGHDAKLWERLKNEATARARQGVSRLGQIEGSDMSMGVLKAARKNVQAAGFGEVIQFERRKVKDIEPVAGRGWPGLIVTNAPYGERLGDEEEAAKVHRELGEVLKERFSGWQASILTGSKELGFSVGMAADKIYHLYNGRLEVVLLNFTVF